MAQVDEVRGVAPREVRRILSTTGTTYGLPDDLLQTGVRRLGFLGLVIALMAPSAYLIERLVQPERVAKAGPVPFQQIVAGLLFAAGAAICVLAWSRIVHSDLMLDLGLVFEVVVAFAISLSENATAWPADQPIRGISWNCLWIAMYVVAIPGTYGKSILAAIASACMAPFGLLVAVVVNGNPIPDPNQLAVLLLPPYVAAAWAIPAGRYLYRLGAQVNKARELGSYELVEKIGHGAMGEVWMARHRMLARVSAIKLINSALISDGHPGHLDILLRRFQREARATAALRSPNTIVLYDYGVSSEGSFYYVMELLDGLDLETLIRRYGPAPPGRVIYLLRQVAKSLAEAHEKNLVHRDVKPKNVFSCRMGTDYDFVKVLDFGLVKMIDAGVDWTASGLTGRGTTAGTPAFMAPEAILGRQDLDGRADLYSLGCVGYWLLTGQLVFDMNLGMAAMLMAHVQTPPVPPSYKTETPVPRSLEKVILNCLEKNADKRYQTARDLVVALDDCSDVESWMPADAEQWWRAHVPPSNDTLTMREAVAPSGGLVTR
ncbi:MAG: serine/threonine-protein kinase [Bryobacteraceae bacterium]